jgi:hypothetical protein
MGRSRSKTAAPIGDEMRPQICDFRSANGKVAPLYGSVPAIPGAEKINLLLSEFRGTCGNYACPYDAFHPLLTCFGL